MRCFLYAVWVILCSACGPESADQSKESDRLFGEETAKVEFGRLTKDTFPITQRKHAGHHGVDIGTPTGTPLLMIAYGSLLSRKWEGGSNGGCGNTICTLHGKYWTRNCHLSAMAGLNGRFYYPETTMGRTGNTGRSTGPHLHIELYKESELMNPAANIPM